MKRLIKLTISILITLMITACAGTSNIGVPVSGIYDVSIKLAGGTGKAHVDEMSTMTVEGDSRIVRLSWSSPNYDYMIVEGQKYLPVNTEGNSVFEVPVPVLDEPFTVVADTVAMSKPHEIEYTLTISLIDEDALSDALKDAVEAKGTNEEQLTNSVNEINAWIKTNLTGENPVALSYAKKLTIDSYDNDNYIVTINGNEKYLITEDKEGFGDKNVPKDLRVINTNPKSIYVVGTGSMDYFVTLDELTNVKYSSLDAGDWDNDEVNEALREGYIEYAGKYSAPDFELLRAKGCDLIVENTMITHSPEVLLQLQKLDFPVIIDYSIYEESILGRMEWIKLYGLITGKIDEAKEAFGEQEKIISNLKVNSNEESTLSIGFFAITSQGTVSVRKIDDNVCDIIRLAGGKYGFADTIDSKGTGSITIQMEEFYNAAKDCDILIYNSTIAGEVTSKEELASKCELIRKCRAFSEDKIYCTTAGFYQSVMELGEITRDVNKIINGDDDLTYLVKVN